MSGPDPLIDESEVVEDRHAPWVRVGEVHITAEATSKTHLRGFGLKATQVVEQEFANFPDGEQLKAWGNEHPWDEVVWLDGQVIALILGRSEGKPKLVWVRDEATRKILID